MKPLQTFKTALLTIALGLPALVYAEPAFAQIAKTMGNNPQIIGNGGEHQHDYEVPPPPLSSLGGAFELTDQYGKTVTDQTLRGQWALIYGGYAKCQASCPTALNTMANAMDMLGDAGKSVQPIFVDFSVVYARMQHKHAGHLQVDPVAFAQSVHPRLLMLSGKRKQMFDLLRTFKVRQEHNPLVHAGSKPEEGMRIDHTTRIYLVGPDGKMAHYYYHTITPEDLAKDLKQRMQG